MTTTNRRFGWHSGSVHARNATIANSLTVNGASVTGSDLPMTSGSTWYVNPNLTKNGNGESISNGFTNLTDALAVAGNYDTIIVLQSAIMTCPTAGWTITQTGLKIIGTNLAPGTQSNAIKKIAGTTPMFLIKADRVEIANLCLSQRIAYPCIQIGDTIGQAYYQIYIHECNIEGYGTANYGITPGGNLGLATGASPVNMVVENNYFTGFTVAAIAADGDRCSYLGNTINVTVDTIGIWNLTAAGNRPGNVFNYNNFRGISGTTTKAIMFNAKPTVGDAMIIGNMLSGTFNVTITDCDCGVLNYVADASGGALIAC
jgi:hypothetical protein